MYAQQHGERVFYWVSLARTAMIPVALLGTYLIWNIGRRFYGAKSGSLAATLWVLSPTVLTFGASISPDVTAAVFGLLAAWRLYIWLRLGTDWSAFLLGIASGLAMLSKASWLILPPIIVGLTSWYAYRARKHWVWGKRLKQTGVVAGTCWLFIHGGYEFQGVLRPLGDFEFVSQTLRGDTSEGDISAVSANRFRGSWLARLPAPLPADYIRGIDIQKRDFEGRMDSYFLGRWRDHGWLHYYAVAVFLKEPLAIWVIAIAGWGWRLVSRTRVSESRTARVSQLLVFAPGITMFVFVSCQTGFNHHLRYVLPFFPCLYLLVAAPLSRISRPLASVCVGLACWYAVSSLSAMPRTYSFFTEAIGGSENGWKYIGDSNLDWGQDLLTAKRWIEANPGKRPVYMVYDVRTDFKMLGMEAVDGRGFVTPEGPTRSGWWIVTQYPLLRNENRWFRKHSPTERLSVTTSVFQITDAPEIAPPSANEPQR
ncbi:ArnT family glycosyltransferase [Roseimaritima sediminicola]|uniref:ArnT family glycosyltransferase n=1 Tax=Roseimaritima sediminicola TaxID=2662066 RepID=UPI001386A102|nr:glycosyltransferase family 39 protein [Roseimaritima sediminicola]